VCPTAAANGPVLGGWLADLAPTVSLYPADPIHQFSSWFTLATNHPLIAEPELVVLATATAKGRPSSRPLYIKRVDERGFVFFTNYESRKARELAENPFASITFYWSPLHRSVRVVGTAEKISREETDEYFRTRPVGSRVGAWASPQSSVLEDGTRTQLQDKVKQLEEKYRVKELGEDADIPAPEFWGGYRIVPEEMEFWIGQKSRLHDRFLYTKAVDQEEKGSKGSLWKVQRLSP